MKEVLFLIIGLFLVSPENLIIKEYCLASFKLIVSYVLNEPFGNFFVKILTNFFLSCYFFNK